VRLALVLCAFLAGCATCGNIPEPPARFTGDKTAFSLHWMPEADIDGRCATIGVRSNIYGRYLACTWRDNTGWQMLLPNDADPATLGCLLWHENGHLPPNPWPWNHPNPR